MFKFPKKQKLCGEKVIERLFAMVNLFQKNHLELSGISKKITTKFL